MIVKFFGRGKGKGKGPIDYLLGKDWQNGNLRDGAKVLWGDPALTKLLIDNCNFAQNYTAGCLTFEEAPHEITQDNKHRIMELFERTLFNGLDPDQRNILWVEHTDKDLLDEHEKPTGKKRLELNFLIPNIEMRTGKRLQPYYHLADFRRVNAYQTIINNNFRLSDPNDPAKKRPINPYISRNMPTKKDLKNRKTEKGIEFATHTEAKERINAEIERLYNENLINSRQDILDNLPALGVSVDKITDKSIVVKADNPEIKKNIRLNSPIYTKDFDFTNKATPQEKSEIFKIKRDIAMPETLKLWQDEMKKKYDYNRERYTPDAPLPYSSDYIPPAPTNAPQSTPRPNM